MDWASPAALVTLTAGGALSASDTGDLSGLAQYGVLGIVCTLLLLYAKSQTARESARADRGEKEIQRLNAFIAEQMVPVLVQANDALKQNMAIAADMQRVWINSQHDRRDGV